MKRLNRLFTISIFLSAALLVSACQPTVAPEPGAPVAAEEIEPVENLRRVSGEIYLPGVPEWGNITISMTFDFTELDPETHEASGYIHWRNFMPAPPEGGTYWKSVDSEVRHVIFGQDVGEDPETFVVITQIVDHKGWGQGEPGRYAYFWFRDTGQALGEGDQWALQYYSFDPFDEFYPEDTPLIDFDYVPIEELQAVEALLPLDVEIGDVLVSAGQPIVLPAQTVAEAEQEVEPKVGLDEAMVTKIETLVETTMRENQIPGFAIGIVKDGELVYAQGFGVANLESEEPVTPQSLFHFASIAKTTTATGIMQLVAQGKIDLDAPVTDYLPYFTLTDKASEAITIRQLLTHTAGMPDPDGWNAWLADFQAAEYDDEALERYVRGLSDWSLLFTPGERWEYSTLGFNVLGDVIAKASGQSYEAYMQENIFTPLGMIHTTAMVEETDPELLTRPHVVDEAGQVVISPVFPYSRAHGPGNNLYSSVEDMARYATAHLNRGELDGVRILPESIYDEMWSPYVASPWEEWFGPLMANYGLGWWVGEMAGGPAIGGYGADPGFQSHLVLLPEEQIAIVALVNLFDPEEEAFLAFETGNAVMELMLDIEESSQ